MSRRAVSVVLVLLLISLISSPLAAQVSIQRQAPQKGWLGIFPEVNEKGLVLVSEVVAKSPAAKSGLKVGDVLLAVNGKAIANLDLLFDFMSGAKAGQKMKFRLLRGQKKFDLVVTLGVNPEDRIKPVAPKRPVREPVKKATPKTKTPPRRMAFGPSAARVPQVVELKNAKQFAGLLNYSTRLRRPVLVEFTAPWCGPGLLLQQHMAKSPLKGILSRYLHVRVNVDTFGKIADKYKVDGIPHLEVFAPGGKKRLGKLIGVIEPKRVAAALKKWAGPAKTKATKGAKAAKVAKAKKRTRKPTTKKSGRTNLDQQILNELRQIRKILTDIRNGMQR